MAAKITGTVKAISWSTGSPIDISDFTVEYVCSEYIPDFMLGTVVLQVSVDQNDTQITSDLRTALANKINTLTGTTSFVANDIRGCNV